jgi:hypothetical protein
MKSVVVLMTQAILDCIDKNRCYCCFLEGKGRDPFTVAWHLNKPKK